jgi:hypothetical protein
MPVDFSKAMIDAGVLELLNWSREDDLEATVMAVYEAMADAEEAEWEEIKQTALEAIPPTDIPMVRTNSYEPSRFARLLKQVVKL